jgi:hypothetical protein
VGIGIIRINLVLLAALSSASDKKDSFGCLFYYYQEIAATGLVGDQVMSRPVFSGCHAAWPRPLAGLF